MAKNKNQVEADVGNVTPDVVEGENPVDTPNDTASAPASEETKPSTPQGKVRIKCASLAGKAITVGAEIVNVDSDGFLEVDENQARRLLTIEGYEKT